MAETPSTMVPVGTPAPDFALPDPNGVVHTLSDFAASPTLVVVFACNHCPFVLHIGAQLGEVADELIAMGAAVVAINSNDADAYPADSPPHMRTFAEENGWHFPYLVDETQQVAHAYGAACTPDFFVYDAERRLAYRGQFDDARPSKPTPVTGDDLVRAVTRVVAGEPAGEPQHPSMGCNIKWRPGNQPLGER